MVSGSFTLSTPEVAMLVPNVPRLHAYVVPKVALVGTYLKFVPEQIGVAVSVDVRIGIGSIVIVTVSECIQPFELSVYT